MVLGRRGQYCLRVSESVDKLKTTLVVVEKSQASRFYLLEVYQKCAVTATGSDCWQDLSQPCTNSWKCLKEARKNYEKT